MPEAAGDAQAVDAGRQQPARPAENRRGSFFTVDDLPCPSCDQYTVVGYLLIDEHGRHQHTRYRCTFWRSGVKPDLSGALHAPCEWEGWSVPGWRSDEEANAARARAIERGGPPSPAASVCSLCDGAGGPDGTPCRVCRRKGAATRQED